MSSWKRSTRGKQNGFRAQDFEAKESYSQTLNRLTQPELYNNARVEVARKQIPKGLGRTCSRQEPRELLERYATFQEKHSLSDSELRAHLDCLEAGQPGWHAR